MNSIKELGAAEAVAHDPKSDRTTTQAALDDIDELSCGRRIASPVLRESSTTIVPQLPEPSPSSKRSHGRTFTILLALYLTLFVAALDQTIIATAVPSITADLKSASGYTWIGGAYLISNAASLPIWTKLSDIWGRKPLLLVSVVWFAVASVVCAKAKSMEVLIFGRALQGCGGGGCLSLVIVTISDLFSMRRRALWIGILEVMWAVAGGTGPILGGVFAQTIGWQWIFWINLPICAFTFVLLLVFLDVHNPRTRMMEGIKAIDWAGNLSILAVTLMLLLGLDFGGKTFPWSSPKVICLIVFGCVSILVFLFSEKKIAKYPLMPLAIFKNRSNIASLLVAFAHGIVFIAGEFYLPLYLQSAKGTSPVRSGILILPLNLSEAIAGLLCGVLMHSASLVKELMICGTLLMTLGTGLYMNLDASSSIAKIAAFEVVGGLGCGLLFNPPIIAIQAFTAQEHVATATSTQAFIRTIATAIGVLIGGVIFQNGMINRTSDLRRAGLSNDMLERLSGAHAAANIGAIKSIQDPVQLVAVRDAFAWSIRNMWIFYTCVSFCAVISALFVKSTKLSEEHIETKTGLLQPEKSRETNVIELRSRSEQ